MWDKVQCWKLCSVWHSYQSIAKCDDDISCYHGYSNIGLTIRYISIPCFFLYENSDAYFFISSFTLLYVQIHVPQLGLKGHFTKDCFDPDSTRSFFWSIVNIVVNSCSLPAISTELYTGYVIYQYKINTIQWICLNSNMHNRWPLWTISICKEACVKILILINVILKSINVCESNVEYVNGMILLKYWLLIALIHL